MVLALALAACGFDYADPFGSIDRVARGAEKQKKLVLYGAIAGDESSAVLVGHDMLSSGGSAADAAVAMAFMLSVTLPSRASLGGGGVCMVASPLKGGVRMLDFMPPASRSPGPHTDRPSAVPTMVRGMAALHAAFGRLPWAQLIAPAEQLARVGQTVTRPLGEDLTKLAGPLFTDPESRATFSRRGGGPVAVGGRLVQLNLRTLLAQIRVRGAGDFYNGNLARRLVDAVVAAGGSLGREELRTYLPKWRQVAGVPFGRDVLHAPTPPATGGVVAAQMWHMLVAEGRYAKVPVAERPHLLAETAKRAFGNRTRWLNRDGTSREKIQATLSAERARGLMNNYRPGRASSAAGFHADRSQPGDTSSGTGFVVVDGKGLAVACNLTMYHLFGTGRTAPGLGIVLAAAPDGKTRHPFSLGPVLVTRASDRAFRFAAAGSGGAAAVTAIVGVAAQTLIDGLPLKQAIQTPRLHHGGMPDRVLVEGGPLAAALAERGHRVEQAASLARVNAIFCPAGLSPKPERRDCVAANDNRGAGLAAILVPR
ncbi:MAG: gamma-glutamyltransferase [Alphaproteobacteria bacterium]|nr:gamma-glutamyltransferase [Alphaproteobacteria bacterium]